MTYEKGMDLYDTKKVPGSGAISSPRPALPYRYLRSLFFLLCEENRVSSTCLDDMIISYLLQKGPFQVRKHCIQSLNASSGGVPNIGMLNEVNDISIFVAVQFFDQIVFNHLACP